MPYYDFLCHACRKESSVKASISQMSEGEVPCPHCGSKDMEVQIKGAPATHTRSENACPHAHVCGDCCHHHHA